MEKKIYIVPEIGKHNIAVEQIICESIDINRSISKSDDGQLSKSHNDWGDIWDDSDTGE
jgi:hypothetical protein